MKTTTQQTPFEKELQQYFPNIHKFWLLTKFDKKYMDIIETMIYMVDNNSHGQIEVHYQNGKVGHVFKREKIASI